VKRVRDPSIEARELIIRTRTVEEDPIVPDIFGILIELIDPNQYKNDKTGSLRATVLTTPVEIDHHDPPSIDRE
jgi:hypothetical protein